MPEQAVEQVLRPRLSWQSRSHISGRDFPVRLRLADQKDVYISPSSDDKREITRPLIISKRDLITCN